MTAELATMTGIDAPTGLLIGGRWGTGRGGTLPVTDPSTEDVIAQVANATARGRAGRGGGGARRAGRLVRAAAAGARRMPAPGL